MRQHQKVQFKDVFSLNLGKIASGFLTSLVFGRPDFRRPLYLSVYIDSQNKGPNSSLLKSLSFFTAVIIDRFNSINYMSVPIY